MRAHRILPSLLCLSGLAVGCGNTPGTMDQDAPVAPMTDAPIDEGTCRAPTPPVEAPIGSSVGRSFENFTLPTCDGTPYSFYNEDFCAPTHTLTVLSIAALWCVPCQNESSQLTARVTNAYADRGVRVLQILVDGGPTPGSPLQPNDCDNWVSTYGLVNIELTDPGGLMTSRYFPDGSLPSTLIIDEMGIIRFRENGATMGLVSLTAAIDSLLASP